jgi:CRISPR-associated protein Csx17
VTLHLHHLKGCSPAPLAMYLKAIGILRLVAEQVDPDVRGWWQDEHFSLLIRLDQKELEQFFLEEYAPTPFLSPWNKGSGFYKESDPGLAPLENSAAPRFGTFREAVRDARELLDAIGRADAAIRAIKDRTKTTKAFQSDEQRATLRNSDAFKQTIAGLREELKKPELTSEARDNLKKLLAEVEFIVSDADKPPTKAEATRLKATEGYKRLLRVAEKEFKQMKASLLPNCRRLWRGLHARWMSAGIVLDENGVPQFPSLLGTGGNDGNLDFTNNTMLRLGELFDLTSDDGGPRNGTAELLHEALWSSATNRLTTDAIGQFLPGGVGGANSSTGTGGDPSINPWDFVLMMEGAIPFSARATRRLDHVSKTKASAPFAVHSHAAGHSSPGGEKDARGEQWLPLWSKPSTMQDINALFGDGRLQLGRQAANRPVDAARAISRLGVARGINAFTRYGFLERNGQSTLAVPLGKIQVHHRPRSSLIDDVAAWMNKLQRLARDAHAPARLVHAERRLADAAFAVLTHDDTPARWQAVLEAAVEIEMLQTGETALKAGPIPKLQSSWVSAIHDNTPEVRLALALGSAAAGYTGGGHPVDRIRHHWLPLERGARRFQISDGRLANDPRVVMLGRDPIADLAAIVSRRLLEAEAGSRRVLPLQSAHGCATRLADLAELIDGHVELARVSSLGRALMAVDWNNWDPALLPPASHSNDHPEEAWLALRMVCLPWPIDDGFSIPAEPSLVTRLLSGNGAAAVRVAAERLSASGIHLPFQAALTDDETARMWAAALAFPISRSSARRAVDILVPNFFGVTHA